MRDVIWVGIYLLGAAGWSIAMAAVYWKWFL